jgi:hypothetical protein
MGKATKNKYNSKRKGNYKPVVKKEEGGNVSELNYSERKTYIEENYAPFITDAQMIFSIWESGLEYNYKGDSNEVKKQIIDHYESIADYTEQTLTEETVYEIKDWNLVRKDIDPDTDEIIGETELEEISADNTYNFSYKGLIDLNWRVFYDADFERYFYVITPHLGGDIRGNYGDAFIIEGNDKDDLFYRFFGEFISGGASIYLKFADGSEVSFDSEQDSDVFTFRVSESFEPTGMAEKFVSDFEKFDTWYGDEFLEETIDIYLTRKGVATKMMSGGSLTDETPRAYIQVLGDYSNGKWIDLTDYSDGQDVIDGIYDWMNELNQKEGGNREEYEVTDYEGFGSDLYDEYMGANEFDEIIEAYEKYKESDFPNDVISEYKKNMSSGDRSLADVIEEMDNNFFGKYKDYSDFGYEMVNQGVYTPSFNDIYITETDKRILASEEADSLAETMDFDDMLNIAENTKEKYDNEKEELEDKIKSIESEIEDLTEFQSSSDDEDEYSKIAEQIEEKELEKDEVESQLDDIQSVFEDEAKDEVISIFYDKIVDQLEYNLSSWLEEHGYSEENITELGFIGIDYDKIGQEISNDYLIVDYDFEMYFFNNYAKGGRISASKSKAKYRFYIVENNTKKLVSGYNTKEEANEQRKLLVKKYPSLRFEIFTLGNLESKTDLDVYSKKDYVELSALDKIKQVSVDAYRYGKEKAGQASEFLKKHDVKGKITRGARGIWDKTKQGGNWLQTKWREADFGDGKGKAKFFANGGRVAYNNLRDLLELRDNGTKTIILNGFRENIGYVIDLKLDDEELIKIEDGVYETTYKKGGSLGKSKFFADGGGVNNVYIALSKTKNGLLLSERFDRQITNKEIFDYYKNKGYEIIDSNIFKVTNEGVLDVFKDAVSKFIKDNYDEYVDWENTLLSYEVVGDRIIAQSCFVQTKNGNEYKVTPNDLVHQYADGGSVESKYKKGVILVKSAKASNDNDVWHILNDKWKKYKIVNSRTFDLETPYNRGWIDEGISINVYLLKDTETNKYYWDSDYIKAKKNKMADGGIAGLAEVSGMLPSPLPMSTITPMAVGGNVSSEVVNLNNRINNLQEMLAVTNEENKPEIRNMIADLEKQKSSILSGGSQERKKSFWFFKKGGQTEKTKYDVYDNKRMLENQANEVEHHSEELNNQIPLTNQVPAWVIAKMERATTDLSDITHYLDGENKMEEGGMLEVDGNKFDIFPIPNSSKFGIISHPKNGGKYPIRNFDGSLMRFDDIVSAEKYANNIIYKYPYGVPKANMGALLLAQQLLQSQSQPQQQQPQVIYYVPQPQVENQEIIQNLPQAELGGEMENFQNKSELNDFCIENLIGLANDIQSVKYYMTDRFSEKQFESKKYKGRLVIIFKEPASINVVNSIKNFVERATDCHHLFEQSVTVSGDKPNSVYINLLNENYSDLVFGKGGKVYENTPQKISLDKTKKIKTILGDYNLAVITEDFVYFVNEEESDENAQTMMYNKKGELVSDNYFATSDLFDVLLSNDELEYISPSMEYNRQELLKQNN